MMDEQTRTADALQPTLLYQDDWLVAVNKPSGLLVHRSWLDKAETRFAMQMTRDLIGGRHVSPRAPTGQAHFGCAAVCSILPWPVP